MQEFKKSHSITYWMGKARVFLLALIMGVFSGCGDEAPGPSDSNQAPSPSSAILAWVAPTANEDDTPASLSGFNIYQGLSVAELKKIATVDVTTHTYAVNNLTDGTYYFTVTAVGANSLESAYADIANKTIP